MNEADLKSLTNDSLLARTQTLVIEERRISTKVLQCLREVESRLLYAELGFSSLYDFCVKHLRYSEGSAHRRISAMRVLRDLHSSDLKKVEDKIKDGSLSVTNLSLVHSFLKVEKKEAGKVYSAPEKIELIHSIEGRSKLQIEKSLASIQPKMITVSSERIVSDTLTEIRFLADDSFMEKLRHIRELTAHSHPNSTHLEIFNQLADEFLKRKDPLLKAEGAKRKSADSAKKSTSLGDPNKPFGESSRHIPTTLRNQVWLRDGGKCTYVHQKTNQKCESRHAIEIEHIQPFALGGMHTLENLKLLCKTHNQHAARKSFETSINSQS